MSNSIQQVASLVTPVADDLVKALNDIYSLNDTLMPIENSFSIYAWPFSRNLIKAICINKGIKKVKYNRINKDFEKFEIIAEVNFEKKMKKIIKIINKIARDTKPDDLSVYKHRNTVTADTMALLFADIIRPFEYNKICKGENIVFFDWHVEGLNEPRKVAKIDAEELAKIEAKKLAKIKKIAEAKKRIEEEVVEEEVVEEEVVEEEVVEEEVVEEEVVEGDNYDNMTAKDLRVIAQARQLHGAWKATRNTLITDLRADDAK